MEAAIKSMWCMHINFAGRSLVVIPSYVAIASERAVSASLWW